MTRGSQVTRICRQVRGKGKCLILLSEIGRRRIGGASFRRGAERFAQSEKFRLMTQRDARNQTPGPRGPGEDIDFFVIPAFAGIQKNHGAGQ